MKCSECEGESGKEGKRVCNEEETNWRRWEEKIEWRTMGSRRLCRLRGDENMGK